MKDCSQRFASDRARRMSKVAAAGKERTSSKTIKATGDRREEGGVCGSTVRRMESVE